VILAREGNKTHIILELERLIVLKTQMGGKKRVLDRYKAGIQKANASTSMSMSTSADFTYPNQPHTCIPFLICEEEFQSIFSWFKFKLNLFSKLHLLICLILQFLNLKTSET